MPVKRTLGLGVGQARVSDSGVGTGQYIRCLPPASVVNVRRSRSLGLLTTALTSVRMVANGGIFIEHSRFEKGVSVGAIWGTLARVTLLVSPMLFVTKLRPLEMSLRLKAPPSSPGLKCSTSVNVRGTLLILRMVTGSVDDMLMP